MSHKRIFAIIVRHWYNFRHNLDRLVDAFYWPSIDLVLWGLTISGLEKQGFAEFSQVATLVFGVILWFVVWRGQGEITVNFLEELWSENLVNLFASPLKVSEWIIGLCSIGLIKLVMTIASTSLLALVMYKANLASLGFVLIPYITILILMSWAFGFFTAGIFLRKGTDVQTLAWAGAFILSPFSAVYYPLSTLPYWGQMIGSILPSTYVFEGMRQVVFSGEISIEGIVKAFILNAIYLCLAFWFFYRSFNVAKDKGLGQLK